jgi:6-phosphogluconolactonase
LLHNFSTLGKTPRNFDFDPTGLHLVVANQETGNIVIFGIDPTTGRERQESGPQIKVSAPVCITFVADQ